MIGTAAEVEAAYYYQLAKEHSELSYLNPAKATGQVQSGEGFFEPVENDVMRINSFSISPPLGCDEITYDTGVCFAMDIIKKVKEVTLHPQITIFDYLMKPVIILIPQAGSISEKAILEQKDETGKIHFETSLTPGLLTFGNFYAELRFGKNISAKQVFNEEVIRSPVKIHFEVKQGAVHDYIGGTDTVFVKPECDWHVAIF